MKRLFHILLTVSALVTVISCTDFKEGDAPDGLTLDKNELTFLSMADTRSLTLKSGSKWEVSTMPEWIKINSIHPGVSPYEWYVSFLSTRNDGFDREGTIAIKAGKDTKSISVMQSGESGKKVAVESVSLSQNELTLLEGESASLSYTITPSTASVWDVTWFSYNTSVATVSSSGVVTAIAAGTATITVTTMDGFMKADCSVTVKSKSVTGSGNEGTGEGELF